jgi:hypothetical protein
MNRRKMALPFNISMMWLEPKNQVDDWYFFFISVTGFSAKNKHKIVYPNLNSEMRPISHDDNLPVPEPPENGLVFLEQMECEALLHLKPFSTLQTIISSHRRLLQNQKNLISRK